MYQQQVEIHDSWNDPVLELSLSTFGITVQGQVTVEERWFDATGQLPDRAAAFRGQVEQICRSELERALAEQGASA